MRKHVTSHGTSHFHVLSSEARHMAVRSSCHIGTSVDENMFFFLAIKGMNSMNCLVLALEADPGLPEDHLGCMI